MFFKEMSYLLDFECFSLRYVEEQVLDVLNVMKSEMLK